LRLRGKPERRSLLTFIAMIAASLGAVSTAVAHPHVWTTVRSEVMFGPDNKITGIRHAWTFDEFYTAMAVQGLDTDGDGVYSKEELQPLAQVNVDSLQEFEFFTFVRYGDDGKKLPLKPPVDYSIDYDKSVLTLHFTLPFETPIDPNGKEVVIDVFDPSYFVAFGFATEAPVKMSGIVMPGCTVDVKQPDAETVAEAKTLTEAFFSELGPESFIGSRFAQTAIVKCATP
jgi:ABC-type uncharacterized transport system substrate-binding protein